MSQKYSNFIVRSADSIPFLLKIDGTLQIDTPCYDIKVQDITKQSHQVKLILPTKGNIEVEKALFFQSMGVESTMELIAVDDDFKLRYFGEVSMGAAPIIEGQTVVLFGSGDKSDLQEKPDFDEMSKVEMYSYELQNSSSTIEGSAPAPITNTTNIQTLPVVDTMQIVNDSIIRDSLSSVLDSTKSYKPEVLELVYNYSGDKGCDFPDFEVENLVADIDASSFSSQKIKLAKNGVKGKCITTEQVGKIASTLEFEDARLSFVKYAYSYTYDRENFKKLSDLFIINSTRTDFLEFIKI